MLLALVGAVLLFVGVFLPLISVPFLGSLNYFANGKGDGTLVLIAAVGAAVLAVRRRYHWLLVPGAAAIVLLAVMAVRVATVTSAIQQAAGSAADNPFLKGIGQALGQSVQLQWGWAVMGIGAVLVAAAGVVGRRLLPAGDPGRRTTAIAAATTVVVVAGLSYGAQQVLGASSLSRGASEAAASRRLQTSVDSILREARSSLATGTGAGSGIGGSAPVAGWRLSRDTSAMDGSEKIVLSLDADSAIQNSYGTSKVPTLLIRCRDHETEAYIWTGMAAQSEYGEFEQTRVRYRLDDEAPTSALWGEATSNEAIFIPTPVRFAKRLASAKRLMVEFRPFSGGPQIITFTLTGLDRQLGTLAAGCGWKYQ